MYKKIITFLQRIIFTVILVCTTTACASSVERHVRLRQSSEEPIFIDTPALVRKAQLPTILYDTLTTFPRELCTLIASYDWAPLQAASEKNWFGHQQAISCLLELPTNQLASGADDGTICVWNMPGCERELEIKKHTQRIYSLVTISPKRVASSSSDGTIRIWHMPTWECICKLNQSSSLLCVPIQGTLVFENDQKLVRWKLETGEKAHFEKTIKTKTARDAIITLPNNQLATSTLDQIEIWDCEAKKRVAALEHSNKKLVNALLYIAPHYLASGGFLVDDGVITIWDLTTEKIITTLEKHQESVTSLILVGDGHLVSGSQDGTICIWDIRNLKAASLINTIEFPKDPAPPARSSTPLPCSMLAQRRTLSLVSEPPRTTACVTTLCLLTCGYLAVGDSTGRITLLS